MQIIRIRQFNCRHSYNLYMSGTPNPAEIGSTALLQLEHVSFAYAGTAKAVCQDLSIAVEAGEIACLLGPSGCGKTTVLRLVAGFERPTAGRISLNNRILANDAHFVPPETRGIGYVFQDFALFPHLTIAENVRFGLRTQDRDEADARVAELLAWVGLTTVAPRYPHEISGGQRQRVALARALAPRPAILLMDEPFSSLDVELRAKLSFEVRALLKQSGTTALFVTHDQHEAFSIADKIAVMHRGQIEQLDTAYNLYHRPQTRFVADFVGQGVLLHGAGASGGVIETELGRMTPTNRELSEIRSGAQYDVLLRPDDILHDDASTATAEVRHKAFRGADILYTLKLDSGKEVLSLVPSHHNHEIGQRIGIRLEIDHVVAFPVDAETLGMARAAE
jgi:iron(III) transport system ATP-binding protein